MIESVSYCPDDVGWIGGPMQRWNGVDVVIVEVEDRGEEEHVSKWTEHSGLGTRLLRGCVSRDSTWRL